MISRYACFCIRCITSNLYNIVCFHCMICRKYVVNRKFLFKYPGQKISFHFINYYTAKRHLYAAHWVDMYQCLKSELKIYIYQIINYLLVIICIQYTLFYCVIRHARFTYNSIYMLSCKFHRSPPPMNSF